MLGTPSRQKDEGVEERALCRSNVEAAEADSVRQPKCLVDVEAAAAEAHGWRTELWVPAEGAGRHREAGAEGQQGRSNDS